nr:MAG TPA: tail protein [Caudoviricetes sp.]
MPILIHGSSRSPELQQKNVKSTSVQQEITPSEGYDGFSKIIVSPIKLQEKTATPDISEQEITPDSAYDGLSKVTVEAVKSVVQATPAITVATNGLITALATQSAGYVSSGTKSTTKQMTTQASKTVYPGTSRQLAVQSNRYTTGDIYVSGDSNLTAGNIKKGVSIFGVAGSYEGSGGEMQSKSATPTSASGITMSGLGDVKNFVLLVNDIDVDVSGGATISSICYSNGKLIGLQTIYTRSSGKTAVIATTGYSTYLSVTISSGTLTITALQTDNACFDTGSSYILYYN